MARWKHVGTDVTTGTTCEKCGKANLKEGFYRRELYCGACYYLHVEAAAPMTEEEIVAEIQRQRAAQAAEDVQDAGLTE